MRVSDIVVGAGRTCHQVRKPANSDQYEQCSSLLTCDPMRTSIATRMHTPLDFDILTVPNIIDRLEVSKKPTTVARSINGGISHVHLLHHERRR
jgi:hypothetical protein